MQWNLSWTTVPVQRAADIGQWKPCQCKPLVDQLKRPETLRGISGGEEAIVGLRDNLPFNG